MIRLATLTDLDRVQAIVAAAYAIYIPRIGQPPAPMLEDYHELISATHVHVREDGARIAGIIVLIPEDGCMLLDNVAVCPDAQGHGYGAELMAFAEAQARAAGLPRIRLFTHEKMIENQARYKRLGYIETHRGFDKGMHRVYMTKALAE